MKATQRITKISKMCAAGTLGLSMALTLGLPVANAVQGDPDLNIAQSTGSGKITDAMRKADGQVSVFVQFKGKGAFESTQPAAVLQGQQAPVNAQSQVQAIARTVESQGQQVAAQSGAQLQYTTHNAIRGAVITGDAEAIRALANRSDVERITPTVAKAPSNSSTVGTTQALKTWEQTGHTGKDVRIAVVDSGVDYTHKDFGGPGTQEAYEEASKSAELPSANSGLIDRSKFVGGYDLVGDDYDGYNEPKPDNNPLDCRLGGHGTHVAGTAAGYGVDADGNTFKGDFTKLTSDEVMKMKIGPGSAPEAELLGFRVFGCEGVTNVTSQALDRTLDPNGDGDFSDKADIVNLSLGSDFGSSDDPDNYVIDALTRQGVLSVIAAGNANGFNGVGDTYSNLGTPSNAISSLTVANSLGAHTVFDKAKVLGPSDIAGDFKGDYSVNFDYTTATEEQLTGEVVMAPEDNRFACDAFPEGTDFKGKWVFIDWEDEPDTFPCGSKVRFDNLEKAGAKGVVMSSVVFAETAGIAGNSTIPGVRLSKDDTAKVRAAAKAGTLKIQLKNEWIGSIQVESGKLDQLNESTARGQHGTKGFTKPDVAAPGTGIVSAGVGAGDGPATMTGTSMSTPHVAGIAALVKEAHPGYSPADIKAAIMNTATHDLKTEDGVVYSVERVGSGRVDAYAAVNQDVLVYNSARKDQVSTSFGVLELAPNAGIQTYTREITVENKGGKAHTYLINIDQSVSMPGVSLTADPSITVAPGKSAKFKVTATVDPSKLDKAYDPAMQKEQLDTIRQYIGEASGRITLSEGDKQLRVPVQIAPKPVSDMKAEGDFAALKNADSKTDVKFTGTELNQGSYKSLAGVFELGAVSDRISTSAFAAQSAQSNDLQYVGAYSNAQELAEAGKDSNEGILAIGISTWANWDVITETGIAEVSIDTDNDGITDYYLVTERELGLDYPTAKLYPAGAEDPTEVNGINGVYGDIDTNTMDSNAMVLPVSLKALGLTKEDAKNIKYKVDTYSWYVDGEQVDSSGWVTYNPFAPNLAVSGGEKVGDVLFSDANGKGVTLKSNGEGLGALFLHLHNGTGDLSGNTAGEDGSKAQVALFQDLEEPTKTIDQGVTNPHFKDVPESYQFYKEIAWLASRGVTTGYADGTFRPQTTIKRDAMAAFFYRLAGQPQYTAPEKSPFKDVPTTHPFYKEIAWMAEQGITTGYSDGTFRPADTVNRDATAAFLYRYAGKPEFKAPVHSAFGDVTTKHQFYKEIAWLNAKGISTGYTDGTYRPGIPVNRDAMAAFLYRYSEDSIKG